jgi:hypothetical protein
MSTYNSYIFTRCSGVAEGRFAAKGHGVEQTFMSAVRADNTGLQPLRFDFQITQLPNYPFTNLADPERSRRGGEVEWRDPDTLFSAMTASGSSTKAFGTDGDFAFRERRKEVENHGVEQTFMSAVRA